MKFVNVINERVDYSHVEYTFSVGVSPILVKYSMWPFHHTAHRLQILDVAVMWPFKTK